MTKKENNTEIYQEFLSELPIDYQEKCEAGIEKLMKDIMSVIFDLSEEGWQNKYIIILVLGILKSVVLNTIKTILKEDASEKQYLMVFNETFGNIKEEIKIMCGSSTRDQMH